MNIKNKGTFHTQIRDSQYYKYQDEITTSRQQS